MNLSSSSRSAELRILARVKRTFQSASFILSAST